MSYIYNWSFYTTTFNFNRITIRSIKSHEEKKNTALINNFLLLQTNNIFLKCNNKVLENYKIIQGYHKIYVTFDLLMNLVTL